MYYLYFIIIGSTIYCICILCLTCLIRRNYNKAHLNNELAKTNEAIRESKYKQDNNDQDIIINNKSNDEQQPIKMTQNNDNNYSNQLKQSQLLQLQQMQQLQSYQQYTNFENPYNIAAYQALEFCPPMNHDGTNWKQLNHLNPQQRMIQLMRQQQYIQQMANQAAIAMGYFLEQQQKMQQMQMERQSQFSQQPQNNKNKSQIQKMKHRSKVASVSYVEEEQQQQQQQQPQQQQKNNINPVQFAMSAPNENKLKMPGPPKAKRLDTMDDVLLGQDLPPSVGDDKNGVLSNNDDDFKFGAGGEKTLLELDPRDRPDIDINIDIDLVPPPNPMEMEQLNVETQTNMNMRKLQSLPPSIPDLPFATDNDHYYDEYDNQ